MRSKSAQTMQSILDYIDEVFFETRQAPTVQEIADAVKIAKSSASRYLAEMEKRGMISKSGGFHGVETKKMQKAMQGVRALPVVGTVACGAPIFAEENIESYLSLSGDLLGAGDFFALRARGESMIGAGVRDGDLVIVRKQSTAEEGQIVVAMIDGECTLKRYFLDRKRKKIRLHPENDAMEDMYFDEIEIQGVAKKVVKNLE